MTSDYWTPIFRWRGNGFILPFLHMPTKHEAEEMGRLFPIRQFMTLNHVENTGKVLEIKPDTMATSATLQERSVFFVSGKHREEALLKYSTLN